MFRSNKRKENLGASYLVKQAMDQGLTDALRAAEMPVDRGAWDAVVQAGCLGEPDASPSSRAQTPPRDAAAVGEGGRRVGPTTTKSPAASRL